MIRQWRILTSAACLAVLTAVAAGCGGTSTPSTFMTLYQSTEHGFSVEYPEGWTESPQTFGTQFSVEFQDPEGLLTAMIYLQYECQELSRGDFISGAKSYIVSLPQYRLVSERDLPVGEGISGHEITAEGDLGAGKVEEFKFLLLVRGKQGFWVGVRGEPTDFDQQKQVIDAILDSFKLLPTYTFAAPEPWPGGTYTGAGFTIDLPEGWCQYPPLRTEHVLYFAAPERTPSVHISVQPVAEDTVLVDYVGGIIEGIPSSDYWTNFNLLSQTGATLGDGTPAYEFVFTGISDLSPGYTSKCKYLIAIRGEQAFWVMATTDPTLFQQQELIINQVIYSLRPR